ncbi:MAG TPA: ribbon-helix-helix protein, CopG family [Peptococcaceae bacterium]|nr:ribbon-helix-helix protein, CopG family [Peptococcaceae bacterium]
MSSKLRSVTVKLQSEMFEQIKKIAEKRGETISDTIRYLINRGLEDKIYKENTKLLAEVVREQIEQVMKSYVFYPSHYPSLDHTEHPTWTTERLFNRRVNLCRIDRSNNTRRYSQLA